MIVRFSLALAGWILAGGASMPDGQGGRREVTETIVVLGPGGQTASTVNLPRGSMLQASTFRKLEAGQRDSVAQIRAQILRELNRPLILDRPLRDGRPALMQRRAKMSRLLIVLDALSADSEAEYHKIVARLGVTLKRSRARDEAGRAAVRTDYAVDGKTLVSRTTTMTVAQNSEAPQGGPSAEVAASNPAECEWTDEDGYYWLGECASQQQIDDATAILAATNADFNDVVVDAANDISYCQQVFDGCWETNDPFALEHQARGGPSADGTWCAVPSDKCYTQTVSLGLTMASYFRQAYKLGALVTAIAPPAGAILDTVFGLAVVAGGAYLAGRALSACLLET